jgi:hypothetical protein
LRLRDPITGAARRTLDMPGDPTRMQIALAPDGATLAAGRGALAAVHVWDTATKRELLALKGEPRRVAERKAPAGVHAVALSADARQAATTGTDGYITIWDLVKGKELLTFPAGEAPVRALAFSADGRAVATSDAEGALKQWDAERGMQLAPIRSESRGREGHAVLLYAPGGKTLAHSVSDRVTLYDTASGKARGSVPRRAVWAETPGSLAFAPDGKTLALARNDGAVDLVDVATASLGPRLAWKGAHVLCVTFSADGSTLVASSMGGGLRFWELVPAPQKQD